MDNASGPPDPDRFELAFSRMMCLLEEINLGQKINQEHWQGFHPQIYGKCLPKAAFDLVHPALCKRISGLDVTKYSLELQLWWRDNPSIASPRVSGGLPRAD